MTECVARRGSDVVYLLICGRTDKWEEYVGCGRSNAGTCDSDMCGDWLNFNTGPREASCLGLVPQNSKFVKGFNFLGPYITLSVLPLVIIFTVLLNEVFNACVKSVL